MQTPQLIIWILMLLIIIVVSGLLGLSIYHNRRMRKRNEALVTLVKQSLSYRDELMAEREQTQRLRAVLERNGIRVEEQSGMVDDQGSTKDNHTSSEVAPDADRVRFDRMLHQIVAQQIFLIPRVTKKDLQELTGYPAYLLASSFRRYTSITFATYINRLRMEHAAQLLIENPNFSIDAIAQMCGMVSRQYFHRRFVEFFGITPTAFRETRK